MELTKESKGISEIAQGNPRKEANHKKNGVGVKLFGVEGEDAGSRSKSGLGRDQETPKEKVRTASDGPSCGIAAPVDDIKLMYDPVLECYYDPQTSKYYTLK